MTATSHPRTMNLALRRARQSMRMSQAQFAEAVRVTGRAMGAPNSCSKRLVQKWETGEHTTCRAYYLTVLEALTGLNACELGFTVPADYTQSSDTSDGVSHKAPTGTAALTRPAAALYGTREMIDGSLDRLVHTLDHPASVDARTAHFVQEATARLFDLERHSPARLLTPTVDRHLSMVTALLTAARVERVRRSLTVSSGHAALLSGWLAFDRGNIPSSLELWAGAISAAQSAADDDLFAAVLTFQSYAAARRGDPAAAWELAHSAAMRTRGDYRATAWATTRVALYAAQLGERKVAETAMRHALEVALYLPDPTPGDGGQPWTRSFDQARLLASVAHAKALLEEADAADYAAQAVDALTPATVKSRAIVLAEAALTAAIAGEFKLCFDYGSTAGTLTRELDVSVAADLLREVVSTVLPNSHVRPIRELLPQLALISGTADLQS